MQSINQSRTVIFLFFIVFYAFAKAQRDTITTISKRI